MKRRRTPRPSVRRQRLARRYVPDFEIPEPRILLSGMIFANGDTYDVNHDHTLTGDPSVLENDFNYGGGSLTAQLVSGPAHGTLNLSDDGTFTYIPDLHFTGDDSFTYQAVSGEDSSDAVTATIHVHNTNPVASDNSYDVVHDHTLNVSSPGVLANDMDFEGDPLTLSLAGAPSHGTLTLNVDGSFSYVPNAGFAGADSFTYKVNDGIADSNTATVTINVTNTPPVAQDDSYSTSTNQTLTVSSLGVLGNDMDFEGDPLTLSLVSGPSDGSLTLNGDGSFTYVPTAGFAGADSFMYKVNDGIADSNIATVTINVTNMSNIPPVAQDDSYEVLHDRTLNVSAPGVIANDWDYEGYSPSPILVGGPSHGSLTLNGDGSFAYVPAAGFFGADHFTYKVNDGTADSNTATVTINVTNTPPVAQDKSFSTEMNQTLTVSYLVMVNDYDYDGDLLTYSLGSGPSHGALTLNADSSFVYVPAAGFSGTDHFTYNVTDGIASASANVTIDVVDSVLHASDDSYIDLEGYPYPFSIGAPGILGNDFDALGHPLTPVLVQNVSHGTLQLNSDGSFTYTPGPDEGPVSDSFTYKLTDGTRESNVATVVLDHPPVDPVTYSYSSSTSGYVFTDNNHNGRFDSGDTPVAGATVELYDWTGVTLVDSTETNADGYYEFDNLPVNQYMLKEQPPAGQNLHANGFQIVPLVSIGSAVDDPTGDGKAIAVTLAPTTETIDELGTITEVPVSFSLDVTAEADPMGAEAGYTLAGGPNNEATATGSLIGQSLLQISEAAPVERGLAIIDPVTGAYALPISYLASSLSIESFSTDLFDAEPATYGVAASLAPASQALTMNIGRIGYLYNHFGTQTLSTTDAAGLQLAIWALLYNTDGTLDAGAFQVTPPGADSPTDPNAYAAAEHFLTLSEGKDERIFFLNGTQPVGSPPGSPQSEGMIGTEQFNFINSRNPSLSGVVFDDIGNDGVQGPGEPGVGGVTVTLSSTDDQGNTVQVSTVTATDGSYSFSDLNPGTYTVSATIPAGSVVGKVTVGTDGGTSGNGQITQISLSYDDTGTGYDFGLDRLPGFTSTPITDAVAGQPYVYAVAATDPDNDPLQYSLAALVAAPPGMVLDPVTHVLSWTPQRGDRGMHAVGLDINDGRGGIVFQSFTVTVSVPNSPPIFTSIPVVDATAGLPYTYMATANDPDGDALSYALDPAAQADGLTINAATGAIAWDTTGVAVASYPVTLTVSDGQGGTATQRYDLVVQAAPGSEDHAPTITSDPVTSVFVGQTYTYTVTAYDSDGDTLSYALDPAALADGLTINSATGAITWDTTGVAAASYPVTVTVGDGRGGTDTQTFSIAVSGHARITGRVVSQPAAPTGYSQPLLAGQINLQPVATAQAQVVGLDYYEPNNSMLLSNFYDGNIDQIAPDGTVSRFYTVPSSEAGNFDDENYIAVARSGNLGGFTPGDVFAGDGLNDGHIIRISDGGASSEDWVNLPGETGLFRGDLTFDATGLFHGDLIVATSNGAVWTVDSQGNPTHLADVGAFIEGATVVPDDPARYGPLAGRIVVSEENTGAVDAIGYDDAGALTVGHYDLNIPLLETLMVVPANENFYGVNSTATIYGAPASDFTNLVGDILLVSESPTQRQDGSHESGLYRLRWDDTANTLTPEPIILNVASPDMTVWEHVNFSPAALGPIANAWPGLPDWTVYADLNHNGQLDTGEPSATTDANGDYTLGVDPGTYTIAEVPQSGWTQALPTSGGSATGTYQVTLAADGAVASGNDFTNIEDNPLGVDHAPQFTTQPNQSATVGARYRYASHATDPDFDVLTYDLPLHPNGMVVNPTTGVIYWTPTADETGVQNVTERVSDGRGGVDVKSFTVTVSDANLVPYFGTIPKATAYAGAVYRYQAHAQDADGDPVTYSIAPQSTGLTFDTATGLMTWSVAATPGVYQWTITADDGRGGTATQNVSVTVAYDPANQPPVITSLPPTSVQVGRTYQYQVQGSDPDGDALNYVLDSAPAGMVMSPTGLVTWTPDPNANPAPSATIVGVDQDTVGSWSGTYGAAGYVVSQGTSPDLVNLPPSVKVSVTGATGVTWANDTSDVRALQPPPGTTGWKTGGWSGQDFTIDVNLLDGQTHQLALYAVDWDTPGLRNDLFDVTDAATGAILDQGSILGFTGGYQVVWNVTGHIRIEVSSGNDLDAVVSGLFVGGTPVSLHAEDGRGGVSDEQNFQILLTSQSHNQAPVITTTPPPGAVVGQPYAVSFQGSDPDGDALTWGLDTSTAPAGMTIADDGTLLWEPTEGQIGTHVVTVRADDGAGATTLLTFSVTVRGSDIPPRITSNPVPLATIGLAYTYHVVADDPEGESLTFSLPTHPDGMAIDPASGVITWDSPTTAQVDANGDVAVTVRASDAEGDYGEESFEIYVSTDANQAPTITSTAATAWNTAADYQYAVVATDSDGDPVSFYLGNGAPSWLRFDPANNGLLESVDPANNNAPAPPPLGTYAVTIIAHDPAGATDTQSFTLTIKDDSGPTVAALGGPFTILAGTPFPNLQVNATDPVGDPLTYVLDDQPSWMSVSASGLITGTPPANLATTTYANIKVVAIDASGVASPPRYFDLTINADTEPPHPVLTMDVNPADHTILPGTTVHFTASATDNQHVSSLDLYVDGKPVTLVDHGTNDTGSFTFQGLGQHQVDLVATDDAGNAGTFTDFVYVEVPITAPPTPIVTFGDLKDQAVVTAPTKITADVTGTVAGYTLTVTPLNGSGAVQTITGTAPASDGSFGTFDPTMLPDGPYSIQLQATNTDGQVTTIDRTVNVAGQLKLGNFAVSFSDLSLSGAGLPITITRAYDTLNASSPGDFGNGWRLAEADTNLKVSLANPADGYQPSTFDDHGLPLTNGTRVSLILPNGATEGFTFEVTADPNLLGIATYYHPAFQPDPGVTDRLTVADTPLIMDDGNFVDPVTLAPYNPADPIFGGQGNFALTTPAGLTYTINADTGRVLTETDRNGNSLTFSDTGITSSTGLSVTFQRDAEGRITAITDPRGHAIVYTYGATGSDPNVTDLTVVTDRNGNTTQFAYAPDHAFYVNQITDPFGRIAATVAYGTDGRVSGLTDVQGHTTTAGVDVSTLSATATAPGADTPTTLNFDTLGNATSVTDPLGNTVNSNYVNPSDPTGKTTPYLYEQTQLVGSQTITTAYAYDDQGNVTGVTDPLGNTTSLTYNADGQPLSVTDPLGSTTSLAYDANGNLISATSASGLSTSTTYDDHGNVLTSSSPDGTTSNTYYPGDGHIVTMPAPDGSATYTFHAAGQLATSTDARGVSTSYAYDDDGNLVMSIQTWTDPSDPANIRDLFTQNTYDNSDQPVTTVSKSYDPATGTTADNGSSQTFYDAAGRVWKTLDENGQAIVTVYDLAGRAIETTSPDGTVTDTVYDDQGRAVWADDPHLPGHATPGTQTIYDAVGQVTGTERYDDVVITIQNDANGNPTGSALEIHGALLSSTMTAYDAAGRVTSSTDAAGHTTTYQYDLAGHQTEVDDTVNGVARQTTSSYDAAGRVVASTDALGNTTRYAYDDAGRLTMTTYADGTSTSTAYDSNGRKSASIDQFGHETDYTYDANGDLTAVILPAVALPYEPGVPPSVVRPEYDYGYDAAGNLVSVTDPLGHTTTYRYDAFGHKVAETLPLGQTETWTYDALGRLASTTDFDGHVIAYRYDDFGRVIEKDEYADATAAAVGVSDAAEVVIYTYDQYDDQGRRYDTVTVTSAQNPAADGTTTSYYDVLGNLVEIDSPQGDVHYAYDPATGEKTEVWTANTDVLYAYDALGRLTTVTTVKLDGAALTTPLVTTCAYDLGNNLVTTALPNGTVETRSYDALGRLTDLVNTDPSGNVITSDHYTLGMDGTRWSDDQDGERRVEYTYDALGRITEEYATAPGVSVSTMIYTYDLAGNRASMASTVTTYGYAGHMATSSQSYTYDANDRLVLVTGVDAGQHPFTTQYTYDPAGNTLTETDTTTYLGVNTYQITKQTTDVWDTEDRLISATMTTTDGSTNTVTSSHQISMTYDDAGNRTSETVDGQATKYLNDPNQAYDQVLEEYAPGGVLAATYVRGLDLLFQDRTSAGGGAGLSFYAKDGLGSTRALTNSAGAVTDTYTYDAYGDLTGSTGTTTNEFLFAGYQFDRSLGQDYLRARYLNTTLGAFSSRDTYEGSVSNPITENRYLYAGANPVSNVDFSGHDFSFGELGVSMAIGAGFNAGLNYDSQAPLSTLGWNLAKGAIEGGLFYTGGFFAFKYLSWFASYASASIYSRALLSIFSKISSTAPLYEGTLIPKFFSLTTKAGEVFFKHNATEHLAELAGSAGAAGGTRYATALILKSVESAVTKYLQQGVKFGTKVVIDGWELVLVQNATATVKIAVIHAVPIAL